MQDLIVGEEYLAHNPLAGWYARVKYLSKADEDDFIESYVLFLEDVPGTHIKAGAKQGLGSAIKYAPSFIIEANE